MLRTAFRSTKKALSLDDLGYEQEKEARSLNDLFSILTRSVADKHEDESNSRQHSDLPRVITFPYSRHSSLSESRDLIGAFEPLDVYPCTVDESRWHEGKPWKQSLASSLFHNSTIHLKEFLH